MGGCRIMTRRAYRKSRTRKVRKLSHFAVDFSFRDSNGPLSAEFSKRLRQRVEGTPLA